jgi:hypothetical protein
METDTGFVVDEGVAVSVTEPPAPEDNDDLEMMIPPVPVVEELPPAPAPEDEAESAPLPPAGKLEAGTEAGTEAGIEAGVETGIATDAELAYQQTLVIAESEY